MTQLDVDTLAETVTRTRNDVRAALETDESADIGALLDAHFDALADWYNSVCAAIERGEVFNVKAISLIAQAPTDKSYIKSVGFICFICYKFVTLSDLSTF